MTQKNYTHITFVVDRSGSMNSMKHDAQGGINAFFEQQKTVDGKCTYSIYQFDTLFEPVTVGKPIEEFETYHLIPQGGTALYDAQWRAIHDTGKFLRALPEDERPDKVIFITVTDGGENSSTEITGLNGLNKLRNLVREQEDKYSWEFIYIGANQDAFAVGASLGITRNMQYANTSASTRMMYDNMSNAIANSRTTTMDTATFLAAYVDADGNVAYNNTSGGGSSTVTKKKEEKDN